MTNKQQLRVIAKEIDPEQYDEFDDDQYTLSDEEIEKRVIATRVLRKESQRNNKKTQRNR